MRTFTEDDWVKGPIPSVMGHAYQIPNTESKWMGHRGRKQMLLLLGLARLYWKHLSKRLRNILADLERLEEGDPAVESIGTDDLESLFELHLQTVPEDVRSSGLDYLGRLFTDRWEYQVDSQPPRLDWRPLIQDVFVNPFRPVAFETAWRTEAAVQLARQMYESRDFGHMPILADALQDAGCENADVLSHCRDEKSAHVRGCWVVDLVLGKA